jgi:hypothetical protein
MSDIKTFPLKLTKADHARLKRLAAKAGKPIYQYLKDEAYPETPKKA